MTDENRNNFYEYSVTELSMSLKRAVEDNFGFVRVRGELSRVTRAQSGHIYLSLKDEKSVLDGVCWRGIAAQLEFQPEEGLEIICSGRLTTYPSRSRYQLVIETLEPSGVGALMALLEERRRKLTEEGLFADSRKKVLPYLPEIIGVITSPTGVVIEDILHRLRERCPRRVLLWPVSVQGKGSANEIERAILGFNALGVGDPIPKPDLIIVARGGGSLEDLWTFNEEIVVRAVAASEIPLISAIGHETDITLIDFVSDRRAPTPTAAAEMAVPVRSELLADLTDFERRIRLDASRRIRDQRRILITMTRALRNPKELILANQQRVDDLLDRLNRALVGLRDLRYRDLVSLCKRLRPIEMTRIIKRHYTEIHSVNRRLGSSENAFLSSLGQKFDGIAKLLEALSFERVLERGYAVVRNKSGHVISRVDSVTPNEDLKVNFTDGEILVTTVNIIIDQTISTNKKLPLEESNTGKDLRAPVISDKKRDQGELF